MASKGTKILARAVLEQLDGSVKPFSVLQQEAEYAIDAESKRNVLSDKPVSSVDSVEIQPKPDTKPLQTTERDTLLIIIAALLNYDGRNPEERGLAAEMEKWTTDVGVRVSEDTLKRHLKGIPDALGRRKKTED
jgi:hypothetical protein